MEWEWAIGSTIRAMGVLEWLAIDWCDNIGGTAAKDTAINAKSFEKRVTFVLWVIKQSAATEDEKRRASELWHKARKYTEFRNALCHNPIFPHNGELLLMEAKRFLGDGPRTAIGIQVSDVVAKSEEIKKLAGNLNAHRLEVQGVAPPGWKCFSDQFKRPGAEPFLSQIPAAQTHAV